MERKDIFFKNINLLRSKDKDLAIRIENLHPSSFLVKIKRLKNQELSCQYLKEESLIWVHSPIHPQREAQKYINNLNLKKPERIIILGLGLGYLLFQLIEKIPPEKEIIVIEKELEFFYHSLSLFDYKKIFSFKNIRFLIGESLNDVLPFLKNLQGESLIISSLRIKNLFPKYYQECERAILEGYKKERMRVLSFIGYRVSGITYILQDSLDALLDLGVLVYTLDLNQFVINREKAEFNQESLKLVVEKAIKEIKPHFIFTVGCLGLRGILDIVKSNKIPYLSWFSDDPTQLFKTIFTPDPLFYIFTWDKYYIKELKERGYQNIFYLPLATNPKIFKKMNLSKEDKERYSCDISFAGMLADPYAQKMYRKYRSLFDEMFTKKVVDKVINTLSSDPTLPILDLLINIQLQEGIIKEFSIGYRRYLKERVSDHLEIIDCISMRKFRKDTIRELANFGICVYGDKGWLEVKKKGVNYKGYIDNRSELPKLYNASKINLNLTVSQLKTAINMRVFDIGGCGGFMLTDYREDLKNLFEPENEVIYYENIPDLKKKIAYFLKNPEERKKISKAFQERVLREHTYLHRMKEVLSIAIENIL